MSSIQVGILHSLSGTMALSETSLVDATLMAIAEINQAGGVLGRQIEPVIEDGASDPQEFECKARKLLQQDQVAAVFGCWTSVTRKAVLPVFEELNALLWYPVQYEGLECSPNIFYTGSCPNQQVEPAVTWLVQNKGKRFYLLGSDYVFPRTVNKVVRAQLRQLGGMVVGEEYVSLETQEFAEVITRIQQAKPDVVFSTLNGSSNITFYRQYTEAGIRADQMPIMAVSVAEAELQQIGDSAEGHYASWTYFQSLDTPQNRRFVANFQAMYGTNRVTSDPIEAAYTQVYLWKQAVESAQSFEVDQVRVAAYGQTFEAPGGLVKVEPNHHLWKECRIGQILPTGQFEIVFTSENPLKPLPWLGVEELNFSGSEVVINLLSQVSQGIQYGCQLKQKSDEIEAARREAVRNAAELSALFAAMTELVLIRDAQGRCLKVAPTNPSLLLKPAAEMIGTTLHDIFPLAQANTLLGYIRQCLDSQQTVNFEYNLTIREQEIWFAAIISPLSEDSVIWVARDISETKRNEAERKRAQEEAQLMLTITQAISKAPDFHSALEVALHQVVEAIGWNYGEAWIPNADGTILECSPVWYWSGAGEDETVVTALRQFRQHTEALTFQSAEGLPGRVWNHGQPEWLANVSRESNNVFLRTSLAQACGLELAFGVPIIASDSQQERVLAVLVFFTLGAHEQDERLIELTSAVATQLGVILQKRQAEAQIYQKNQEMLSYIQQVEKVTAAAAAVENSTFEPESLHEVAARSDKLGQLARIFTQMVQTVKAREQELAAAKEQLEAVLNAVPGSISWINSGGLYIGVNRHLAENWNLSQDAFIGQEVGFLKGSTQFAEFTRQFLDSSAESGSQVIETHINDCARYYLVAAQKYQQGSATVSVGIDITERRQAEEALRQSEERFRSLIFNIPGAIYRCQGDANRTMELISDSIEEISGYPASEFIHNQSQTYASIIHPDDRVSVTAAVNQALAARQPYILEYRVMHRDGSLRWVYEKGRAALDPDGNALYLDGAIFDVTDRKRAEEALQQSEATNRALIMAIPDLLIRARSDGTYLDIVGRDRLIVQNSAQFFISSSVYDSLPWDKAQLRMQHIQQALQTSEVQIYEQQFIKGGQPQDEEVRIVVSGDDEVLIMVRDITERKRAEEALRIAEENYRSIFENALQGIFQSTLDGEYIKVNPAMARMYGYESPEEMIASVKEIGSQIYVDPVCRTEFKQLMALYGKVQRLEYQVYQQDGSQIWVEENTRSVQDSSGQLLYYEGIVEDITKRKREEAALKRQLEELQIEIDYKKREREVAKITQSDYFQELQAEIANLQVDEFWESTEEL